MATVTDPYQVWTPDSGIPAPPGYSPQQPTPQYSVWTPDSGIPPPPGYATSLESPQAFFAHPASEMGPFNPPGPGPSDPYEIQRLQEEYGFGYDPYKTTTRREEAGGLLPLAVRSVKEGLPRVARDTAVAAVKGIVGVPQALTGLVDLALPSSAPMPKYNPTTGKLEGYQEPSQGVFGRTQEKLGIKYKETQDILHTMYSPETKKAYESVSEAEGILAKVGAAITTPSTILTQVIESAPQMVAGGLIGRGIGALGKGQGLLAKYGFAAGEGAMAAGQGVEQTRAESPTGSVTPKQAAIHVASGALTTIIGVLGGKVASKLGIDDIDKLLSGKVGEEVKRSILTRALAGALTEGTEESLQSAQEQIANNVAQGKPWYEGWDQATVMGALTGGAMGAGAQLASKGLSRTEARKAGVPEEVIRQSNPESRAAFVQQPEPVREAIRSGLQDIAAGLESGELSKKEANARLQALHKQYVTPPRPPTAPIPQPTQEQSTTVRGFHGSRAAGVTELSQSPDDIGIHIGTPEQAQSRLGRTGVKDGTVYEVELIARNPLVLETDPGSWYGTNFAHGLKEAGVLTNDDVFRHGELGRVQRDFEFDGVEAAKKTASGIDPSDDLTKILKRINSYTGPDGPNDPDTRPARTDYSAKHIRSVMADALKTKIEDAGYDSIKYRNGAESAIPGQTGWSYAALRPDQVKIVGSQPTKEKANAVQEQSTTPTDAGGGARVEEAGGQGTESIGSRGVRESGQAGAESEAPGAVPPQGPEVTQSGPNTGTKNAKTDELRAAAGLPTRVPPQPESVAEWHQRAVDAAIQDPGYADQLVDALKERAPDLATIETALNRRIAELEQDRRAGRGDLAKLQDAIVAAEKIGTAWGRQGVARQVEYGEDYSVPGIIRKVYKAKKGSPLDDAELKKADELSARANRDLEAEGQAASAKAAEDAVEAMVAEAAKTKPVGKTATFKPTRAEKFDSWWQNTVDSAKERLKARVASGKAFSIEAAGATALESLPDLAIVGADYIKRGVTATAAWAKRMVDEFGEGIRPHLKAIWQASREHLRTADDQFKKGTPEEVVEKRAAALDATFARTGVLSVASVKALTRAVVDSGVDKLEDVRDTVHAILQAIDPDITLRETHDLMSGRGQVRRPRDDKTSRTVTDISRRLALIENIQGMQRGETPLGMGFIRQEASQAEGELRRQYNEERKAHPELWANKENQLKGRLQSAETAARNRIADMEKEIGKRQELADARTRLDEIRKLPVDQQAAPLIQELEQQIQDLEGSLSRKTPVPLSSAQLNADRAKLAELKASRDALRNADPSYQADEYQKWLAGRKANLAKQKADLLAKVAEMKRTGKMPPSKGKRIRELDPEGQAARREVADAKAEVEAWAEKIRLDNFSIQEKLVRGVGAAFKGLKSIWGSFDFSFIGRQGLSLAVSHPVIAAKAQFHSHGAFWSDAKAFEVQDEIRNTPNAINGIYNRMKLDLTEIDGQAVKREELYAVHWPEKIPVYGRVVKASGRAFVAQGNQQRAGVADGMLASLLRTGPDEATNAELEIIGHYVNAASWRGDVAGYEQAAVALNNVFWTPRGFVGNFQNLFATALWAKKSGQGTWRVRRLIAKEFARQLAGRAVFYSTAASILFALMGPPSGEDDETGWAITRDGQLRIRRRRIDLTGGLSSYFRFTKRMSANMFNGILEIAGRTPSKEAEKEMKATGGIVGRFLGSKIAPIGSLAEEVASGQDYDREPVTAGSLAVGTVTPLSVRDVYESMTEFGLPAGIALSVLAIYGFGGQTHKPPKPKKSKGLKIGGL